MIEIKYVDIYFSLEIKSVNIGITGIHIIKNLIQ